MEKGIKEILELILGIKDLAIVGKNIMADGKINLADLGSLMTLLNKQAELTAAFTGLAEAEAEVKDLTLDEASQVMAALVAAAKEVQAA